jgi:tetratricopeptide (TPR) repeat protein
VPYAKDNSESMIGSFTKVIVALKRNPIFMSLFVAIYASGAGAYFLYQREKVQADQLQERTDRLQAELMAMSNERQSFLDRYKSPSVDVFRRLSFTEKSSPQDQEKLQAALSLNSYARYALRSRDLRKARETLDESLRTFPTLEAQYYLGVVDYLEGNNEEAVGSWTKIAKSTGVPDDIFIYLSLAEYRLGNTEAAKKFSDLYSRSH